MFVHVVHKASCNSYLLYDVGRVYSSKRKTTVWCLSVCLGYLVVLVAPSPKTRRVRRARGEDAASVRFGAEDRHSC